jgi:hypothetical protein
MMIGSLSFGTRDIRIELFKTELQLTGIEPLRAAAELTALELPDDQTQLLDLAIALLHNDSEIAHKLMQQRRICWQIRDVELHA